MNKVIFLLLLSSCFASKNNYQETDNQELYTQAFFTLLDAKKDFTTPYMENDTLRIIDKYYVDSSSLYYYQANKSFEIQFIDTSLFPSHKGGDQRWKHYQELSKIIDLEKYHETERIKEAHGNIIFVSREETRNQNQRCLQYSPLIPVQNNHFIIHEQLLGSSWGAVYTYNLKRTEQGFEFVSRSFLEDIMVPRKDYLRTINFDQTYEEYVTGRQ